MAICSENVRERYERWKNLASADEELAQEFKAMEGDEARIFDAFYRDLAFGTGGLRGVIGAGSNRMNIYTVGKASQGLADYVNSRFTQKKRSAAISYDSRRGSSRFAARAAAVFAANGIQVHLYRELMPTPMLSWAVRQLGCGCGIMITASHNPAKYNGYKVYGPDGCQITTKAAEEILDRIERVDAFGDVRDTDFEEALKEGTISYIKEDVIDGFIQAVKSQSMVRDLEGRIDKNLSIVYSPLNGTGLKPVLRVLKESGFNRITVVKEQERPDGDFPTCPYPNPEIQEAMALGMEYAKKCGADLVLATDPDCDRVGIAVKDRHGEYVRLSGNQVGILLLNYICSRRVQTGTMPEHPVAVKTIVTTDLAARIAADYGVEMVQVLTGFKFIGEQIGRLEAQGREKDYILGFEESYGYLSGSYVRDKDGVGGSLLICEMFAYYRHMGQSLLEVLEGLYKKYGYCLNTLHSYEFEGAQGFEKMQGIMAELRKAKSRKEKQVLGGKEILGIEDYLDGTVTDREGTSKKITGFPASDVLKFWLEGETSAVVRPSGTEPKLKLYLSVRAAGYREAEEEEARMTEEMERLFD